MDVLCLCGKLEEIAAVLAEKIGKTIVIGDVQKMPVVQTRTLELSVVNFEPHGPDQVQPRAGCSTSACNVAGLSLIHIWSLQALNAKRASSRLSMSA